MTFLVPSVHSDDQDIDALRVKATRLETLLAEREAEITRIKSSLATFKNRYREQVGLLHEELEELELAIAEAELGEISKRLGDNPGAQGESPAGAAADSAPRYTSDAVRKLFREVARVIHPDLARDELTRERRHALMIEANRAYARGDEERLRWILQSWEKSPEAVDGSGPEAARRPLVHRIAQIEEQLELLDRDLAALKDTSLWKLKTMVDEAGARGKDLVADTVRRLKQDILAARNRLDALQWRPDATPPGR